MKKFLFIILASILASCTGGDFIRSRAEHFVRSTYPDVDRILYYSVDTVTLGDNMDYRIKQAKERLKSAQHFAESFPSMNYLDDVERESAWVRALDSLKASTARDVLETPAAFQCCLAYNTPTNLVWVQLDPDGNLLNIAKDMMKLYLNPGDDVPGYFELWQRFSGVSK